MSAIDPTAAAYDDLRKRVEALERTLISLSTDQLDAAIDAAIKAEQVARLRRLTAALSQPSPGAPRW